MTGLALMLLLAGHASRALAKEQGSEVVADKLHVEAVVITAGPYGEIWELTLDGQRRAVLGVAYAFDPSGELKGEFLVTEAAVRKVRESIQSESFFTLPSDLSPSQTYLHMPDLRLSVTLDGESHKVELYDPANLGDQGEARRFLTVWKSVFDTIPLEPQWPQ